MLEKLKVWKSASVGCSCGGTVQCSQCGIVLTKTGDPRLLAEQVFCPACQKVVMAATYPAPKPQNVCFLSGDKNPLRVAVGERRFLVPFPKS